MPEAYLSYIFFWKPFYDSVSITVTVNSFSVCEISSLPPFRATIPHTDASPIPLPSCFVDI